MRIIALNKNNILKLIMTLFGLNNLLPNDIVIYEIKKVKADFNSRFDAISRTYKYYITNKKSPFLMIPVNKNIDILKA